MLSECWNELLFLVFWLFLFVCWVLFATMLGSWVIGRENGRMVVSEKTENILTASYLMEEFIFSGIF